MRRASTTGALSAAEARRYLTGQLGLRRMKRARGAKGAQELLRELRCIQLDPLDAIGTNADLVALARVQGLRAGDLLRHLFADGAFEHFAKERCLLPEHAFPHYRQRAIETPWWRLSERLGRLPPGLLETVLEEIRLRGPIAGSALEDRGRVEPLDWQGWKGTAKATRMALEVLWTRCEIVVCGREGREKIYDIPERRAWPRIDAEQPFGRFALLERVEAAGLLSTRSGPHWSMLHEERRSDLLDSLVLEGRLERVQIAGSTRVYLAPAGFRDRSFPRQDSRMRILGPLDPLLWDRQLVRQIFDFEYVWEVYKPAAKRRWGWYVCPLFHRGRLVGRVEGRRARGALQIDRIWREPGTELDETALEACLERHADALALEGVHRSPEASQISS